MSTHMTILTKSKAVVALFFCLMTLALADARPAHAGYWKITFEPVGGQTRVVYGKGPDWPNGADYNFPWIPRFRDLWKRNTDGYQSQYSIQDDVKYVDGFSAWHSPGGSASTMGASSTMVKGSFNVIFTWTSEPGRDLTEHPDPPPNRLFFRETSRAFLAVGAGEDFKAAPWVENMVADDGLNHTARLLPTGETIHLESGGKRCVMVKTGGKTCVKISRSLHASANFREHSTSYGGGMESWVEYKVELGDFALYASVNSYNTVKQELDNIELDAYVKPAIRPAFLNDPESKFTDFDFWEGPGYYSAHAMVNSQTAFAPQTYEWQASGADLTPPKEGTANDTGSDSVAGSDPQKTFNFDFGDIDEASLDKFSKPITTTVNVTITGPGEDADSTSETLTAKAKVHWHLPAGTLFEGTINLENLALPDDGVPTDIDDQIAELEEVRKVFAQAPGTMVKLFWEGGKIVVKFVMPDKFDLVLGVAGKAFKLYKAVRTIEAFERLHAGAVAAGLKRLEKLREKRRLAGKPDNGAINAFVEALRKKSVGSVPSGATRDLDEAGEALKKGASRLGNCFVAGTPVVMADGSTKPIEDVKVGDEVMSRDENDRDGEVKAKKVVQLFKHLATKTLALRFAGGEHIETTSGHPFYVEGQGFVKAGELGIGNSIVTRAGPSVSLESIERKDESATVYNFEVEDFHTYFVGKVNDGLWVHNDSLTDRIATGHAWDHVKDGDFEEGLGIFADGWGHQQKFSDLMRSVMRNPTAVKEYNAGLEDARTYYLDAPNHVVVIEWAKETGDNVYGEASTCYRVKDANPWDHWDTLPGMDIPPEYFRQ